MSYYFDDMQRADKSADIHNVDIICCWEQYQVSLKNYPNAVSDDKAMLDSVLSRGGALIVSMDAPQQAWDNYSKASDIEVNYRQLAEATSC